MHYISYANRRDSDSKYEGLRARNQKQTEQYNKQLSQQNTSKSKKSKPIETVRYQGKAYKVTRCKNGNLLLSPIKK